MENTPITITLTVSDWNAVIGILAQRPFAEVTNLIEGIRQQASGQLQNAGASLGETAATEE